MGHPSSRAAVIAVFAAILLNSLGLDGQEPFRSGVELVNVTATVTDRSGRFVSGLQQSDFVVYRGRSAGRNHALHRGARPGKSRHRARHERQHGRTKDGRSAGGRAPSFGRLARSPRMSSFSIASITRLAWSRAGRATAAE